MPSQARSALMRAVRRKDTKPEMMVRRMLHSRGWRYRVHRKDLPGTPDLVFPSRRKVVFVHGCFWHGHDCRQGRTPETRREFWLKKAEDNRTRDRRVEQTLNEQGWQTLVVWQCELKQPQEILGKIERFLGPRSLTSPPPAHAS
jgi:DNA mismatch endonuclease, patch repair protein